MTLLTLDKIEALDDKDLYFLFTDVLQVQCVVHSTHLVSVCWRS